MEDTHIHFKGGECKLEKTIEWSHLQEALITSMERYWWDEIWQYI